MSDTTRGPKGMSARQPSGSHPIRFAPWVAMAAMAVATLLRRGGGRPTMRHARRLLTPAELDAAEPGRGRCARSPLEIPVLGWKDIFWRTYREMGRDRLAAMAGGITYYILLATFPAIAAFVSLYGIFSDVQTVERQLSRLSSILPAEAVNLMMTQMVRLASQRHEALSLAFVASTLLSVWSANAGMKAMVDALNITFDEVEKRDYVRRSLFTYGATLAALVFLAVVVAILVGAPVALRHLGVPRLGLWWGHVRWLIVFLVAAGAFSFLYRHGPSRRHPKWRWVVLGGALAALVWMVVSMAFSWYVNNVAHLGVTYGSLGAIIAYMLWVWFSAMVLLTAAELNAEIEHQTAIDTTTGLTRPMGERGAVMADTLGKAFTVSPREAAHISLAFCHRQVGYVKKFARRFVRL